MALQERVLKENGGAMVWRVMRQTGGTDEEDGAGEPGGSGG